MLTEIEILKAIDADFARDGSTMHDASPLQIVRSCMRAMGADPHGKPLDVASSADFAAKIPDIVTHGDPDTWKLICKASSKEQGWMKSTKAMLVPGWGVLVQVTTQLFGSQCAESVVGVPGASLRRRSNGTITVEVLPACNADQRIGRLLAEEEDNV